MSNTATTNRFNLNIPVRLRLYVTYWTFALILFAYLFGIMKFPYKDLNTLNVADRTNFHELVKEYRANQDRIIYWENLDQISGYVDPKIPGIIKKIKAKNEVINQKRGEIYKKANYKAWQYQLANYLGWDFPFNLHRK